MRELDERERGVREKEGCEREWGEREREGVNGARDVGERVK